jgi:sec-independent protein translocase protein TatC
MISYIIEIKNRVILLFITWFSVILVGYFYKETLLFLFLESEMFINNEFKVDYFIFTDVIEIFSVYIQLIWFISLQICILFFLYHSFMFIGLGLFFIEYLYFSHVLKVIICVWFLSIFFSKYLLIPMMWKFFINFQNISFINLYFEAKLIEYLNFYIKFYYVFVCYCQILTFLYIFFNYINANVILVKKFRKLYYYFFVIFSTLISPPDIFSQIGISLILIIFYEFFIYIYFIKFFINKIN